MNKKRCTWIYSDNFLKHLIRRGDLYRNVTANIFERFNRLVIGCRKTFLSYNTSYIFDDNLIIVYSNPFKRHTISNLQNITSWEINAQIIFTYSGSIYVSRGCNNMPASTNCSGYDPNYCSCSCSGDLCNSLSPIDNCPNLNAPTFSLYTTTSTQGYDTSNGQSVNCFACDSYTNPRCTDMSDVSQLQTCTGMMCYISYSKTNGNANVMFWNQLILCCYKS